jgi:hypothetical protein
VGVCRPTRQVFQGWVLYTGANFLDTAPRPNTFLPPSFRSELANERLGSQATGLFLLQLLYGLRPSRRYRRAQVFGLQARGHTGISESRVIWDRRIDTRNTNRYNVDCGYTFKTTVKTVELQTPSKVR